MAGGWYVCVVWFNSVGGWGNGDNRGKKEEKKDTFPSWNVSRCFLGLARFWFALTELSFWDVGVGVC